MRPVRTLSLLAILGLCGCAASNGLAGSTAGKQSPEGARGRTEVGAASFMDPALAGRRTASGDPFDPTALVAAHRTLPFGTRVRVTDLDNGRHVVLTIVDRGPFRRSRILDVSPRAARVLGFERAGTARVRLEVLGVPDEAGGDPR